MTTAPIIFRVWNYCNTLSDVGVGYGDYLEQLTYMLQESKNGKLKIVLK